MEFPHKLLQQFAAGEFDSAFALLYKLSAAKECRARYSNLVDAFSKRYGEKPVAIISAPGRTEIGGNHTDHQHGRILAAAVDVDVLAAAAANGGNEMRITSHGYPEFTVNADDLSVKESERGESAALVRGIAAWFKEHGHRVQGFDAFAVSTVLSGSGLSSSAAFEIAVGNIINVLGGSGASAVDIAIAGQYAESKYFGKPCGLMDQTTSSVGGCVMIDFAEPINPIIKRVPVDLAADGLLLCTVDTKGSHVDLTPDYASIPYEMRMIARELGHEYLREVDPSDFYGKIAMLRKTCGDRPVLRAMHFFEEDSLVPRQAKALEESRIEDFKRMVVSSGLSSFTKLQNIYSTTDVNQQGLSIALAASEEILSGKGAWRVHGGGFAGTILALVPEELKSEYEEKLNAIFGEGSCHFLTIRPAGGIEVKPGIHADAGI
ncbi:MAG: galactokinase [Clostridiales bacterium]|jgi:galactokinase|nr:galactokinase [Clostridiales bacterium]